MVRMAGVIGAAALGGAMNAIAGGGTLLTFPALIGLGIPGIVANATSTVALWPGAVSSFVGYRRALTGVRPWALQFAVPSLTGGLLGAWLLLRTPAARFDALVPWLVLVATVLFLAQPALVRLTRRHGAAMPRAHADDLPPLTPALLGYQFLVGTYAGYFGAGAGILMLAALGFMGFRDIHRMNGLKNWGGLCANAVAAATFALSSLVNWPVALAMAAGASAGAYGAARVAQRVPQRLIRALITAIGFGAAVWLFAARRA
jgi:uncharacterized protein